MSNASFKVNKPVVKSTQTTNKRTVNVKQSGKSLSSNFKKVKKDWTEEDYMVEDIYNIFNLISEQTVKYNEALINKKNVEYELKLTREHRNRQVTLRDQMKNTLEQTKDEVITIRRKLQLTPVKTLKTPKGSLFSLGLNKIINFNDFQLNNSVRSDREGDSHSFTSRPSFFSKSAQKETDNEIQLTDNDQDTLIEELETKISLLKKENSELVVNADELNDKYHNRESENKSLKSELKQLEAQLSNFTKERVLLKKEYDKISHSIKDNSRTLDVNLDSLSNENIKADIVDHLYKKNKK